MSKIASRILPYHPAELLAEGLWQVAGGMSGVLPVRTMIIRITRRLSSGGAMLHSAIAFVVMAAFSPPRRRERPKSWSAAQSAKFEAGPRGADH